ncbi:AlbA family DNA-binding domain-containing protein [Pedobacter cryoconitis]|uniref:Putative DNA-binding protein n=1 Tax=Pedobacter cryoconitis TaxID=188932 RepID=A0A327S7C9_9SPHI|nr:ATP-binding protein [Pedobacter cryoconitis]RAJ24990.1 putative DNA-binding protein [Pedobacter cryoconitis]
MPTIDELIKYHQEGEFLDFKREEYKSIKKHKLVIDVLSFANSEHQGDKFIIIGIEKVQNVVTIFDVQNADDAGIIQQTITDNIKPSLKISYTEHQYLNKNIVILTILNPENKPYAMKKRLNDPSNKVVLKEDSMKIRIGNINIDMRLEDLEKIYSKKFDSKPNFQGKVKIFFKDNEDTRIQLKSIGSPELPSKKEWLRIQDSIMRLEDAIHHEDNEAVDSQYAGLRQNEDRKRAIHTLKAQQNNVTITYRYQDYYLLGEILSNKLNFGILNNGDFPLKNATLIIDIPQYEGLHIVPRVLTKEEYGKAKDNDLRYYPKISKLPDGSNKLFIDVDDIKHKLPQLLLLSDIRLYFYDKMIGTSIKLNLTLHAENYQEILKFELFIDVV